MRLLHKGNKRMGMKLGAKPATFTAVVFALLATCPVQAATILNDHGVGDYQIQVYQPIGQSFTAIDPNLLSIGFAFTIINPPALNASITLDLLAGDGTGGASVATRTFTPPPMLTPILVIFHPQHSMTSIFLGRPLPLEPCTRHC